MKMKCPVCQRYVETKTKSVRRLRDDTIVRRRRECKECGSRWTTYEVMIANGVGATSRADAISEAVQAAVLSRDEY